jgi:hypothetical protein
MAKGVRALEIFLKDPSKPLPIKKAVQAFCALCTGKYADGPEDCRQGIGSGSPCPLYNFHPYNPSQLPRPKGRGLNGDVQRKS